MQIKIISDGTKSGTRIVNAETGETIEDIISITWYCDARDGLPSVRVDFIKIPVELTGELKEEA